MSNSKLIYPNTTGVNKFKCAITKTSIYVIWGFKLWNLWEQFSERDDRNKQQNNTTIDNDLLDQCEKGIFEFSAS